MAEAIGVVASGVTIGALATGITSSIIKLKLYWDQVQDAPDDVSDLIEELEILGSLLVDIEDDQRQNPMSSLILDSTSTSRCLQHCRKGADRLKELTDNLSTDLGASNKLKRKWASAKVVLKRNQVDRYKAKLERVIRLLSLSHQLYTRALLQLQPDIIVAKLSQSPTSGKTSLYEVLDPDHSSVLRLDATATGTIVTPTATHARCDQYWNIRNLFGTFKYVRRRYSVAKRKVPNYHYKSQELEEIRAEYWGPSWLVNRVWTMRAVKASYGIHLCSSLLENNVKGLQELFSKMEASPFDCTDDAMTPLTTAASYGSHDACEFLMREGADPNYLAHGLITSQEFVLNSWTNYSEAVQGPRLLLNKTEHEIDIGWYQGSKEGFPMWQQSLDPLYYQRPLKERVGIAINLADSWNGPEVVRLSLALGPLPSLAQSMTGCLGRTLLNAVAMAMGVTLRWSRFFVPEDCGLDLIEWGRLLKELIVQGADLHFISFEDSTPILNLLQGLLRNFEASELDDLGPIESSWHGTGNGLSWKLTLLLKIWLGSLQESGVDLEEYGRKEVDLHLQGLVSWTWLLYPPTSDATWFLKALLMDLH